MLVISRYFATFDEWNRYVRLERCRRNTKKQILKLRSMANGRLAGDGRPVMAQSSNLCVCPFNKNHHEPDM